MQFTIINTREPLDSVGIIHNGQQLTFETKAFKSNSIVFNDLYGQLNMFVSALGKEKQDRIFDCYTNSAEIFDCVFNPDDLNSSLQGVVKMIYETFTWDEVSNWVYFKSNIRYPTSLRDTLPIEDMGNDEKTVLTYLKHEYVDLIVLSLALHFMIPIWGTYISRQQKDSGSTYKEEDAFGLIRSAWVAGTPAMLRLRNYMQYLANKHPDSICATIHSLGTSSLPDYLLSLSIIRRVVCSVIDSSDPVDNVIAKVYTYITGSVLRSVDKKFGGMVSDKKPPSQDEGDKTSTLEQYKIKQYFPDGDAVMINVFMSNPERIAVLLDSTIDLKLVRRCLEHLNAMDDFIPQEHHMTMCKYLMSAVIPPKTVNNLNYVSLINAMAVTQAMLWHWGFTELAILATVRKSSINSILFGDIEKRYNPLLLDEVVALYPYYSPLQRTSSDKPEQIAKKNNVVVRATELFVQSIVAMQWESLAPTELLNMSENYNSGDRSYRIPQRIRDMMMELFIFQSKRNSAQVAPGKAEINYDDFVERFKANLPEIWEETHRNMDIRKSKTLHQRLMDSLGNFIKAHQ